MAIILALVLIAVVGYKYSPLLLPETDLTLSPVDGCDLNRQPCRAVIPGGGSIELGISPNPIPVVKPLRVVATFSGLDPSKVELDFQGVAMEMGFNRLTLTRMADGRYTGEATIPVCVTGRMLWRATLLVEADHRRIAVPYLFDAPVAGS
ncbi:MAG: FixH family protein [Gammaproteobacteria bacterium]|nr:FixH family protein [Gammaproteobacteria bacterium]MBU1415222.1 FixH family protein [Gammaproteobacteria bacterium]